MICDLRSQSLEELESQLKDWGQPAYRATQLLAWLYDRRVTDWEMMTNLPKALREQLKSSYSLQTIELVQKQGASDSTQKFLWRLNDHSLIESVLIPANPALYGESSDRHTLCVSTQVGCAYGCKFCASGLEGWKRNLRADEIVEQVLAVERWHEAEAPKPELPDPESQNDLLSAAQATGTTDHAPRLISNLVIMGMGEPLANYDALLKALKILNAPWGGGIGARKITVSTSGLAPQIRKLAEEPLQFRLAISLHGATDQTRDRIMPINRKYPLSELVPACEYYQRKKGRMITLATGQILVAGFVGRAHRIPPCDAVNDPAEPISDAASDVAEAIVGGGSNYAGAD